MSGSSLCVTLFLMGISMDAAFPQGDRLTGETFAPRSPVVARQGMVCTSQPLAASIGLDVLKAGGSAVDAAIATNAALGLMEPTGSGVGGDLFALVWMNEERRLYGLNGSGRAPKGMTLENLKEKLGEQDADHIPLRSAFSVSVPGCVDGWFSLHERFGRLPMEDLLAPAIEAAREGFPVTEVIAYYWGSAPRAYRGFDEFERVFLPEGRSPKEGEIFRNPDLAKTYEAIARRGREGFYEGPVAEAIVAAVVEAGGALALDDLKDHRSEWVEALSVPYRGYEVWELPPNGQGIAALQMLRILEGFDLTSMGFGSAQATHVQVEAKKLVYEDRARFYADPSFSSVPLEGLLSEEYAKVRRALMDQDHAAQKVRHGDPTLQDGDTVYLTVADAEGNVVSWIQSNYTGFGSGIVPSGTGFCLQNRGNLFHLDSSHPNAYAPGKRPFHTIIPAMMTREGQPVLSFGVMGGAMQPQGHVQIVTNLIDFGMNVQEAGDAPRWRHDGSSEPTGVLSQDGGVVHLESQFRDVGSDLSDRGHRVVIDAGGYGGYQGIWIEAIGDEAARIYRGGSESRKDGLAIGY